MPLLHLVPLKVVRNLNSSTGNTSFVSRLAKLICLDANDDDESIDIVAHVIAINQRYRWLNYANMLYG